MDLKTRRKERLSSRHATLSGHLLLALRSRRGAGEVDRDILDAKRAAWVSITHVEGEAKKAQCTTL